MTPGRRRKSIRLAPPIPCTCRHEDFQSPTEKQKPKFNIKILLQAFSKTIDVKRCLNIAPKLMF